MITENVNFYRSHSVYTHPGNYAGLFKSLSGDFSEFSRLLEQLIITPREAMEKGLRVNYKAALRDCVFIREVPAILNHSRINRMLTSFGPGFHTRPEDRAVLESEQLCLLALSFFRSRGRDARARSGFIWSGGEYVPYWLCQVNETSEVWTVFDVASSQDAKASEDFMLAGESWLRARAGDLNPVIVRNFFKTGFSALKFALFNDVNALMKQEMLCCDWRITPLGIKKPRLFAKAFGKLDENDLDILDSLALYSLNVDTQFSDLKNLYDSMVQDEHRRLLALL